MHAVDVGYSEKLAFVEGAWQVRNQVFFVQVSNPSVVHESKLTGSLVNSVLHEWQIRRNHDNFSLTKPNKCRRNRTYLFHILC